MSNNDPPKPFQPLNTLIASLETSPGELDADTLNNAFAPPATPGPAVVTRDVFEAEIEETDDPRTLTRRYMQKTMLKRAVNVYDTNLDDPDPKIAQSAANKIMNFVLDEKDQTPGAGVNVTFNLSGGPPATPPPTVVGGATVEINEEERR